jgi:hypothetical protein
LGRRRKVELKVPGTHGAAEEGPRNRCVARVRQSARDPLLAA